MPTLKVTIGERETVIDTNALMLSELEVLEEFADVDVEQLNSAASLRKVRFVGHLLWLADLRRLAAEQQMPLREAALKHPRDRFDVNTADLSIELVELPKDPPAATTLTRTPPTGSRGPRARSASSGSPRSARSPKSSPSGPGKSTG